MTWWAPVCETGDFLGKRSVPWRLPGSPAGGAFRCAYGFTMSSIHKHPTPCGRGAGGLVTRRTSSVSGAVSGSLAWRAPAAVMDGFSAFLHVRA